MKKYIPICLIILLLFCSGCPNRYLLDPVSSCVPLSNYKTLVIAPIDGESTIVAEAIYVHLPRPMALAVARDIKEQTEKEQLFKNIVISNSCTDNAIKVESRIHNLTHKYGNYYSEIRGKVIDCQTNEVLYTFELKEKSSKVDELPGFMALNIHSGIENRLKCEPEKKPNKNEPKEGAKEKDKLE
jgi:hypothetical protein